MLDVTVRSEGGDVRASGRRLKRTQRGPMCSLVREDDAVSLDEGWQPSDEDVGQVVLLPGGEAGKLISWWHADAHSA